MKLGEIIKIEREVRGLSVSDLAKQVSLPESTIIRIEQDPDYIKTHHGILQAKAVLKYLNIDVYILLQPDETLKPQKSKKFFYSSKYLTYSIALILFAIFLYANAVYRNQIDVQIDQNSTANLQVNQENLEYQHVEKVITLKSEGDVWITAIIDGEKIIFNLKEGESKTIRFENKVTFETIGNVNQLTMILNGKEVSLKDREIVHNIFADEEGIFYNGYNILRGKPKI
ncbi:MAG: hypothetical protein N2Z80_06650 [Hydrogenothermaceae bacterium]|nr:hypothetical protein [Hydrogenothermaceae bacterium]